VLEYLRVKLQDPLDGQGLADPRKSDNAETACGRGPKRDAAGLQYRFHTLVQVLPMLPGERIPAGIAVPDHSRNSLLQIDVDWQRLEEVHRVLDQVNAYFRRELSPAGIVPRMIRHQLGGIF
jgi:hypothetical protein